jgi:hypothetical protein
MNRSEKSAKERCGVRECPRAAYCRGRCQKHYSLLLAEQKSFDAGLHREETPVREPFVWAGDEEALYKIYGEEEKCQNA